MRNAGWLLAGAIVLGGLFWPWLLIFGAFALLVAVAGAVTRRKQ